MLTLPCFWQSPSGKKISHLPDFVERTCEGIITQSRYKNTPAKKWTPVFLFVHFSDDLMD
jgi:hypothetical protein